MDPRERYSDFVEMLLTAMDGRQASIYTAMPGIITLDSAGNPFNVDETTCSIQPAIMANVTKPDGSSVPHPLPVLIHCPVIFPGGGGYSLTFPLAEGDECLVVIANRCIDSWWASGGVQIQSEFRMHDLSDGFCIPGVKSRPKTIPNISTNSVQLRSDDGNNFIELKGADANVTVTGVINTTSPGGTNMTSPTVTTSANLLAGNGATGTFTSGSGNIITVQDGIIVNIF